MPLTRLDPADVDAVVDVFRASRAAAMPWLPVLHSAEEDLGYFGQQLAEGGGWGVWAEDRLLGFAITAEGWLRHLYVAPAHQGQGVGSALLSRAVEANPHGLRLWAFARNEAAVAFYLRRGFRIVLETDGAENEEREPDVQLEWRVDRGGL